MIKWKRVASGDYETSDGRFRCYQIPDVSPPAWNVEDTEDFEIIVNGAATKRDASAIFEEILDQDHAVYEGWANSVWPTMSKATTTLESRSS